MNKQAKQSRAGHLLGKRVEKMIGRIEKTIDRVDADKPTGSIDKDK